MQQQQLKIMLIIRILLYAFIRLYNKRSANDIAEFVKEIVTVNYKHNDRYIRAKIRAEKREKFYCSLVFCFIVKPFVRDIHHSCDCEKENNPV